MKKVFTLACMSLLALTCTTTTSCNKKTYLTVDEAKDIAAYQLDNIFPEDFRTFDLLDVGLPNKIYRGTAVEDEEIFYEVDIDAVDGTVLQVESQLTTEYYPEGAVPPKDIGKEEIKKIIYKEVPGSTDFDVLRCEYCNGEEDDGVEDYYDVSALYDNKMHDFKIKTENGEIIEHKIQNLEEDIPDTESDSFTTLTPASNNNEKRPVWMLAHKCNTNYYYKRKGGVTGVRPVNSRCTGIALAGGCNGFEIDIRHRRCDDTMRLCHPNTIAIYRSESLIDFLSLPEFKDQRTCAVVLDLKEPEYTSRIMHEIHNFQMQKDAAGNYIDVFAPLDSNGNVIPGVSHKVNFIYELPDVGYAEKYFTQEFCDQLWENEGLAIDYTNDVDAVNNFYKKRHFTRGYYGNGIFSGAYGRGIYKGCNKAVRIRDNDSDPYAIKGVESWTSHRQGDAKTRLEWGLNYVLLDPPAKNHVPDILNNTYNVRLANRNDYIFGSISKQTDVVEGDYIVSPTIDSTVRWEFRNVGIDPKIKFLTTSLKHDGESIVFHIAKNGDNTYKITDKQTSKVLTYHKSTHTDKYDLVKEDTDKGDDSQKWIFEKAPDGFYVRSKSGRYMTFSRFTNPTITLTSTTGLPIAFNLLKNA